jgi:hypothetical protein
MRPCLCARVCSRCRQYFRFVSVVACSSRSVTNVVGITLACLFLSSRSRLACNWNMESHPPAFSAPSGLSSVKKGASGGPSLPKRKADLLPCYSFGRLYRGRRRSSSSSAWLLTRRAVERSGSSTATRSTETSNEIVRLFHYLLAPPFT